MIGKVHRAEEKPDVLLDYVTIAQHIERWTEDRALADRTVDAIRAFAKSLKETPHRGTKRNDLRPGLRIVPFKKRTAIAIEIDDQAKVVTALQVFYGGQDCPAILGRSAD